MQLLVKQTKKKKIQNLRFTTKAKRCSVNHRHDRNAGFFSVKIQKTLSHSQFDIGFKIDPWEKGSLKNYPLNFLSYTVGIYLKL